MWDWEVEEVVPITCIGFKPLGVTSTFAVRTCYARRRGLGLSEIHERCELLINGST